MKFLLNPLTGKFDIDSSDVGTPTLLTMNQTYKVPKNRQVLFTEEIDMELNSEIEFDENSILSEVA